MLDTSSEVRRRSFVEAVAAFVALPGIVAYAVPLWALPHGPLVNRLGAVVAAAGTALLLWCVRDFYVAGKGTLAPWAPPARLVRVGLYQHSRNPMYVSVLLVLIGWTVAFESLWLAAYVAILTPIFEARVKYFEEPWLERAHGEEWISYRTAVRRWLV